MASFLRAIKINALKAVIKEDTEYKIRDILRWYSKTFYTPLHIVEDEIPLPYIFQTYFECYFEDLEEDQIYQEIAILLESEEQRKERLKKEAEEEMADREFQRQVAEEAAALKQKKSLEDIPIPENPFRISKDKDMELVMGPLKEIPPDIEMKFVDPDEFEKEIEGLGLLDQPDKKR